MAEWKAEGRIGWTASRRGHHVRDVKRRWCAVEKSGRKKDGGHWLKERGMGRTE